MLTHVTTDKEAMGKRKYVNKYLPSVKLITVVKSVNKCEVVDCEDTVLVDDFMGNLELWAENGGIPVKFSDKGKDYDIMSVSNLGMLIDMYDDFKSLINSKGNNKTLVNLKK
jgi:hypothetical protein